MPPSGLPSSPAPPSRSRELWQRVRRGFRWFRILALLTVLALAGFLYYWHQTGLPDFVKNALLEALRHRGLDLQFQSLHFRWDRGLIAREVTFGRDQLLAGPLLRADEVQIVPDAGAALRGQLQINLLRLQNGRVLWRFGAGQPALPPLEISGLQTELLIRENVWELQHLSGQFAGADFRIHGVISNALAFSRQWAEAQTPATSGPSAAARAHLWMRDFARALTNYHFAGPCNAELNFQLDALHWEAARLELRLAAEDVQTPWGAGRHLKARIHRQSNATAPSNALADLEITAHTMSNHWGRLEAVTLTAQMPITPAAWWQTNLHATLQAGQLLTQPLQAGEVKVTLEISPLQTNFFWQSLSLQTAWATSGPVQLRARSPTPALLTPTAWQLDVKAAALSVPAAGRAGQSQFSAAVALDAAWPPFARQVQGQGKIEAWEIGNSATGQLALVEWNANLTTNLVAAWTNTLLSLWQRAAGVSLDWRLTLATSRLDQLNVAFLENHGSWTAPLLTVSNLQARLGSGRLSLAGQFNAERRVLQAHLQSACDPRDVAVLLPPSWQSQMSEIRWDRPPHLELSLLTTLPDWPNPPTNALANLLPLTRGRISIQSDGAQFRQLALDNLLIEAEWDGQRLRAPRVEINAGECTLQAGLLLAPEGEIETEINWKGTPDPLLPLLSKTTLRTLSLWQWQAPPHLQLRLTGNWHQPDSWQATGELQTARFSFRDVAIEALQTRFAYASNVLTFYAPRVLRPEGEARARKVEADFNSQMVFLSEARGTVDPMAVAQAIGPHVVKTLAPYRFGNPVKAEVSGDIPMHGELGARVAFQLAGSPFAWWRFHASNVTASVLWRDESVTITNLWADFYGGRLRGDIALDFSSTNDTEMQLRFSLSQVQFAGLMADISDRTNRVEGLITGHLNAQARASDWKSWNGFGNVALTDGLIWEIPIFGLFSPVLNAISPGLGNSRAREAYASFVIQDSVIRTDDLVIQAAGYNLKYRGTVNFDYEVNARVEAELLRETKMFGPALSLLFKPFTKLFEYRVTGTLAQPKTKPVYIPSFLMKLLTPIRSLRELFHSENEPPPTTPLPAAPPEKP
ncbi:MAG: hypothetical protein N3J91_12205 [Verrucomicrobiae bacterium]|nr:hypothetical protein [Verrucomicrobiae bacterium]